MSGTTSTSPISMRAAAANNNQKKQRGLFKGWKKNTKAALPSQGDPSFQKYVKQMPYNDDPHQQSPNRRYNNGQTAAPQFSPATNHSYNANNGNNNNQRRITNVSSQQQFRPPTYTKQLTTPQQINQNYPTNDEYYHYCNDELSRQLQLAAQQDKHLNEERKMTKRMFRERHCAPYNNTNNNSHAQQQPLPSQEQLQQKWHQQQQQTIQKQNGSILKQGQRNKLSHPKEDLQTQSTQATKDTASSSSASHTSSFTNTSQNNNNGKEVTPVTNALSTAAQVFQQQRTSTYTTASGRDGENDYVKEWTPMSDSFLEQPISSGDDFDWHIDNDDDENEADNSEGPVPPPQKSSAWREAVDPNSGKTYYYNILTKEVSWTIPNESSRSKTPPPPPPPSNNNGTLENTTAMHMAKTPHRNNTSGVQKQQQKKQQQQKRVNKSPPRARSSHSLDSIAEDDDDYYDDNAVDDDDDDSGDAVNANDDAFLPPKQQPPRARSKSPFRVISRSRSPVRHASSSFHSDPNRGDDPDGVGGVATTANDGGGGGGRRSASPFRVFNNNTKSTKKKKGRKPVVNMPPSLQRGRGSGEVGDVVSLVSYYDDPSIGALSSLDDTTLASRSLSKRSSSVVAAPSADDVGGGGGAVGGSSRSSERRDAGSSNGRRDASQTPPRHKKHADPPGNSIDEIFHQKQSATRGGGNNYEHSPYRRDDSRSPYRRERQQQRRLPDPSPMRQQQQQQQVQHSPYQQHQSPYSRQSPQKQQHQRSPYKHHQPQQQQQDPPYMEEEQEHRSPYSGQHQHDPPYMDETPQERSPYSEQQQQQYLQQPQIFVDEDGNQWMVTPQEVPKHNSLQPRHQQQQQQQSIHRQQPKQNEPRQIYYDEEGQPYYYEEEDHHGPDEQQYQQQLQHQEHSMPPPELQTPRQGWQWSEQKEPTHSDQYPDQGDYPAEEYFEDGNGNFISFITPDPEEGDNHVLDDFESIGMLTGDEDGPPLEEPNGVADDDTTAANTLNTVDLVAEVKRVWRHVQRYEQKKSMKTDNCIEKKDSEEELLVHQFTQAFVQASPGRANMSSAASMTRSNTGASMAKSSTAGASAMTSSTQRSTSDAAQISPEKEVVSSTSRGRSRSKDSRLGDHIRSTSVHSRALSSKGRESPATGSDYAMMSHGDTEMDGAFISEGMDDFFLSPGKPQKSTLKQQARQKQHLLHPSQVAAAQKLMQNNKAAISASAAPKPSKIPIGEQQHDLASPYDFNKVKSTGTNYSQKTQTISNTTTSNMAMKANKLEKARKQKELTNRSRSPPRPPDSRNIKNATQIQQREMERKESISPARLYAMALKSAKERKTRSEC
ncbi:hypothetical protein QTG54_009268 [Skeletonema marinoi]|uniref:WW domain-containing protein n=1 Tax=Skeletonema marinoi TaxID=267567 RepID=A0AAD8Y609_9STRA|nr:hypothetical protein QTG54_009268 [Skeletonema marinoi]